MEILTYPNEKLRIKCEPIENITPEMVKLAKNMYQTMLDSKIPGIGLAAPQIGEKYRIFVMKFHGNPIYFFNPVILRKNPTKMKFKEGCLSFPDEFYEIKRSKEVWVKYLNVRGQQKVKKFINLYAICVQHEIDHLNGILFTDYLDKELNNV